MHSQKEIKIAMSTNLYQTTESSLLQMAGIKYVSRPTSFSPPKAISKSLLYRQKKQDGASVLCLSPMIPSSSSRLLTAVLAKPLKAFYVR